MEAIAPPRSEPPQTRGPLRGPSPARTIPARPLRAKVDEGRAETRGPRGFRARPPARTRAVDGARISSRADVEDVVQWDASGRFHGCV